MGKKRRKSKKKKPSSSPSKSLQSDFNQSSRSQSTNLQDQLEGSENITELGNSDGTQLDINSNKENLSIHEEVKQVDTQQHPLLVQAGIAFHDGNYQYVHHLIESLDSQELSESDQETLTRLRNRVSFDPVALWFPLGLFILWALLFYRSLH